MHLGGYPFLTSKLCLVDIRYCASIVNHLEVITRHPLVRAKGEVLVLLYVFFGLFLFCQRFLDNPRADSRQILHAGVLCFQICLLV